MMKRFGFYPADILLPKGEISTPWSVIACDQYTESESYWQTTRQEVGAHPSTLHLILPEKYLESENVDSRIEDIHQNMQDYLQRNIFTLLAQTMIYTERTLSDGRVRRGLIGALDLEEYDYAPDTHALCRASEQTVTSRIPPRKKVRENAPLELPHILLLIDDRAGSVIETIGNHTDTMRSLYDFDLMQGSGHIKGWQLSPRQLEDVQTALQDLAQESQSRYGEELLYLVGDGNHSLATAKACYEQLKQQLGTAAQDHPARYALVEINNLQEESLTFMPIHRAVWNVDVDDLLNALPFDKEGQQIEIYYQGKRQKKCLSPRRELVVGTLQSALDKYLSTHPEGKIDYIHDETSLFELCDKTGGIALMLPALCKDDLFEYILHRGALPRKSFSMGHAKDKRFYLECRKIK